MAPRLLLAALLPLSISLPLQALEVTNTVPTVTASSFPAAPPPVGLPQLQLQVSCPALQQRIASAVGGEASVWSVSVADSRGRLLADLNGARPRIPASNQKLISTAIALDRLGPDYRLTTRLWRQPDGTLQITGEGDPDLDLAQLQRFAKLALGSGGSSGGNSGGSGGRRTFSPRLGSVADCEVGLASSEVFSTRSRRTGGKGARQLDRSARPTSPSAASGGTTLSCPRTFTRPSLT